MRPERKIAIAKDLILFLGGLFGIGYQQVSGDVNTVLLVIFTAMTGVPGLTNLVALLRGTPIELEPPASVSESSESNSST